MAEENDEPRGTFRCDVCGLETPHAHTPWEVEQERHARPAFEELLAVRATDSDGFEKVIKPWRSLGPHSQYTRMTDAALPEKWYWFNAGWYAKWKQS